MCHKNAPHFITPLVSKRAVPFMAENNCTVSPLFKMHRGTFCMLISLRLNHSSHNIHTKNEHTDCDFLWHASEGSAIDLFSTYFFLFNVCVK